MDVTEVFRWFEECAYLINQENETEEHSVFFAGARILFDFDEEGYPYICVSEFGKYNINSPCCYIVSHKTWKYRWAHFARFFHLRNNNDILFHLRNNNDIPYFFTYFMANVPAKVGRFLCQMMVSLI